MKNDSCEAVRAQLGMLLYGELSFDEEETVDRHLEGCAECRAALERQQELHAALDEAEVEPPASLLWESRRELQDTIAAEHAPSGSHRWWDRIADALTLSPSGVSGWLRPVGAAGLVIIGFMGARLAPTLGPQMSGMFLADPGAQRVRSVESAPNGGIQIVLDETR